MSETLHIVRKDLCRLRWWLAAWVALLVTRVAFALGGTEMATADLGGRMLANQAGELAPPLTIVLAAALIARLVHDEPLVGLDWWWLARPYDRRTLLQAKLLIAGIFMVGLPLVAELVVMNAFQAGTSDMWQAVPSFLARDARSALGLMVVAVLTPTLVVYSLALVGIGVGLSLLLLVVTTVMILRFDETAAPVESLPPDPTAWVVASLVFIGASLTVIAYQYVRRRFLGALLLVVAGLLAVAVLPAIWPWSWAEPLAAAPGGLDAVTATVDAAKPEIADATGFARGAPGRSRVAVPVRLNGLPPEFRIEGVFGRGRLELPGERVFESARLPGHSTLMADRRTWFRDTRALQAAIGEARLDGTEEDEAWFSATLLALTDEELAEVGTRSGRLEASLEFLLWRSFLAGTLPLAEGAALDGNRTRTTVVRVDRHLDGCTIVLRRWQVTPLLARPSFPQYDYVLRNVRRREAVMSSVEQWQGSKALGLSPLLLRGFTVEAGASGFDVHTIVLEFPIRAVGRRAGPAIDAAWMADAELVMVETIGAGVLTRSLVIDDFRVQQP